LLDQINHHHLTITEIRSAPGTYKIMTTGTQQSDTALCCRSLAVWGVGPADRQVSALAKDDPV